jgi:hypothetical protein
VDAIARGQGVQLQFKMVRDQQCRHLIRMQGRLHIGRSRTAISRPAANQQFALGSRAAARQVDTLGVLDLRQGVSFAT